MLRISLPGSGSSGTPPAVLGAVDISMMTQTVEIGVIEGRTSCAVRIGIMHRTETVIRELFGTALCNCKMDL